MYKISFYVPESHLETVKKALFMAGAGRIGNYDCCAWEAKGRGQFRPLEGSHPFSGTVDQIEKEEEFLVEMVCEDQLIKSILAELIRAHPYETPAYSAWKILQIDNFNE